MKAGDISAGMLGVEGPSGSLGKYKVTTSLAVRDGMAEATGRRVLGGTCDRIRRPLGLSETCT